MRESFRKRTLADLKYLGEEESKHIAMTGGEGSWLTAGHFQSKYMSPIFRMVEHDKLLFEGEDFLSIPTHFLVYKSKKNIKSFTYTNSVKMSIQHLQVKGIDMVTVIFMSNDVPKNPLIVESYFNPFYVEDGINDFIQDMGIIAKSSIQFFFGYIPSPNERPKLEGVSFVEYTPEFKNKAKEIFDKLSSIDKSQTKDQFLEAKRIYQNTVPLHPRSIEWLGDWRKTIMVREFMNEI